MRPRRGQHSRTDHVRWNRHTGQRPRAVAAGSGAIRWICRRNSEVARRDLARAPAQERAREDERARFQHCLLIQPLEHYHVADRDTLRELVAAEVVQSAMQDAPLPEGADWRAGLAHFARVLRDAVIRSGAHSVYFVLPASGASRAFGIVEQVYALLVDAGLTPDDAVHAISAINQITYSSARETILARREGGHPQRAEVLRALAGSEGLAGAKQVAARWHPGSDEQFEYNTAVVIAGIEARL